MTSDLHFRSATLDDVDAIVALVTSAYRGDASRGTPGVGLGLSVVSAVARLHGGSLALADNQPGLRATLQIAVQRV